MNKVKGRKGQLRRQKGSKATNNVVGNGRDVVLRTSELSVLEKLEGKARRNKRAYRILGDRRVLGVALRSEQSEHGSLRREQRTSAEKDSKRQRTESLTVVLEVLEVLPYMTKKGMSAAAKVTDARELTESLLIVVVVDLVELSVLPYSTDGGSAAMLKSEQEGAYRVLGDVGGRRGRGVSELVALRSEARWLGQRKEGWRVREKDAPNP